MVLWSGAICNAYVPVVMAMLRRCTSCNGCARCSRIMVVLRVYQLYAMVVLGVPVVMVIQHAITVSWSSSYFVPMSKGQNQF